MCDIAYLRIRLRLLTISHSNGALVSLEGRTTLTAPFTHHHLTLPHAGCATDRGLPRPASLLAMHQTCGNMPALAPPPDQSVHKCDRFCTFEHAFGNLYICRTSGVHHICDSNCDQGMFYDRGRVICRLSKVVRGIEELEPAARCAVADGRLGAVTGGGRNRGPVRRG